MTTSTHKTCRWYPVCPIKRFVDQGHLDPFWTRHYCLTDNSNCVRYHMEEHGRPHPDNMLPNGQIDTTLPG